MLERWYVGHLCVYLFFKYQLQDILSCATFKDKLLQITTAGDRKPPAQLQHWLPPTVWKIAPLFSSTREYIMYEPGLCAQCTESVTKNKSALISA